MCPQIKLEAWGWRLRRGWEKLQGKAENYLQMKSAPCVNLHLIRGSGEAGEAHNSVSPTSKVGTTNKNKLQPGPIWWMTEEHLYKCIIGWIKRTLVGLLALSNGKTHMGKTVNFCRLLLDVENKMLANDMIHSGWFKTDLLGPIKMKTLNNWSMVPAVQPRATSFTYYKAFFLE